MDHQAVHIQAEDGECLLVAVIILEDMLEVLELHILAQVHLVEGCMEEVTTLKVIM